MCRPLRSAPKTGDGERGVPSLGTRRPDMERVLQVTWGNMKHARWEHEPRDWERASIPLGASSSPGGLKRLLSGFKPKARHSQTSWEAMKKRSLSNSGRPGPISYTAHSQLSRLPIYMSGSVPVSFENCSCFRCFPAIYWHFDSPWLEHFVAYEFRV